MIVGNGNEKKPTKFYDKFRAVDEIAIDFLDFLNFEQPPQLIIPKDLIAYLPGWFAFDFEGSCTGILTVFDPTEGTGGGNGQADCVGARKRKGIGILIYSQGTKGIDSIDFFGFWVFGRGVIWI